MVTNDIITTVVRDMGMVEVSTVRVFDVFDKRIKVAPPILATELLIWTFDGKVKVINALEAVLANASVQV